MCKHESGELDKFWYNTRDQKLTLRADLAGYDAAPMSPAVGGNVLVVYWCSKCGEPICTDATAAPSSVRQEVSRRIKASQGKAR